MYLLFISLLSLGTSEQFSDQLSTLCCQTQLSLGPVVSNKGWRVSDITLQNIVEPQIENNYQVIPHDDAPDSQLYYWLAPEDYLGDRSSLYNHRMIVSLEVTISRGDTSGQFIDNVPDILLFSGQLDQIIGYKCEHLAPKFSTKGVKIFQSILLNEQKWFKVGDDGQFFDTISKSQFIALLSDLRQLLVRANYHTDQISGTFLSLEILIPSQPSTNDSSEPCVCATFTTTNVPEKAHKCDCNNHALSCDTLTGICKECLHNTHGPKCNKCKPGYYGFPENGSKTDCKPCACPLLNPENNFASTCVALADDNYHCDCIYPYTGPRCDECVEGYHGNPLIVGGKCELLLSQTESPTLTTLENDIDICTESTKLTDEYPTPPTFSSSSCLDDPCVVLVLNQSSFGNLSQFDINNIVGASHRSHKVVNRMNFYHQELNRITNDFVRLRDFFSSNFLDELKNYSAVEEQLKYLGKLEIKAKLLSDGKLSKSRQILNKLDYIRREAHEIIKALEQIEGNTIQTIPYDSTSYKQAITLLTMIQSIDFSTDQEEAKKEQETSSKFLEQVTKKYSKQTIVTTLTQRLRHVFVNSQRLLDEIQHNVMPQVETVRKNLLSGLRSSFNSFRSNLMTLWDEYEVSVNNLKQSRAFLDQVPILISKTEHFEEKISLFADKMSHYKLQLSIASNENANFDKDELGQVVDLCERKARYEEEQFRPAVNDFQSVYLEVVKLFQKISKISNIKNIIDRVILTMKNFNQRLEDPHIGLSTGTLKISCSRKRTESENLAALVVTLTQKTYQLNVSLSSAMNQLKISHEIYERMMIPFYEINRLLDLLTKMVGPRSRETILFANHLLTGLDLIEAKVSKVRATLEKFNYSKIVTIEKDLQKQLEPTVKSINAAKIYVNNSKNAFSKFSNTILRVKSGHLKIAESIADLRTRIIMAHQKAAEIRVSLSSNNGQVCLRSFTIETQPSTVNHISLTYALKPEAQNSLVFFISDSNSRDFMSIEMVNRKIRFKWDVGSGPTTLEHPTVLQHNIDSLNERWYKIDVTRIATNASLSVRLNGDYSSGSDFTSVWAISTGASILNLNKVSHIYIGGYPEEFTQIDHLVNYGFQGCISDLVFDDKTINLWDFKENKGCNAGLEGPVKPGSYNTFHFDGKGSYAVLPQISRYSSKNYLIVMSIRTFDEDGLLFFCSDKDTGDFMALSIVKGKIAFHFVDGHDVRLILMTNRTYNNGIWFKISAERSDQKAIFLVDEEKVEGIIERQAVTSELDDCMVNFGGVPPNFTKEWWPDVTFRPFEGCMKDVQIDATALNLVAGQFYGVKLGCHNLPPRGATFYGNGYLELRALPLLDHGGLSFTFKTELQRDCILLVSLSERNSARTPDDRGYYSVAIIDKFLEAKFHFANKVAKLKAKGEFQDGHFHTVSLIKRNNNIRVTIDDKLVEKIKVEMPNSFKIEERQRLFLGGVPPNFEAFEAPEALKTRNSFEGVMKDLILNGELAALSEFTASVGVGVEVGGVL